MEVKKAKDILFSKLNAKQLSAPLVAHFFSPFST